jgi:hypothetical protein
LLKNILNLYTPKRSLKAINPATHNSSTAYTSLHSEAQPLLLPLLLLPLLLLLLGLQAADTA